VISENITFDQMKPSLSRENDEQPEQFGIGFGGS